MESNQPKPSSFTYGDKKLYAADSNGNVFGSVNDLWQKELDKDVIEFENNNPELKQKVKGERVGGID